MQGADVRTVVRHHPDMTTSDVRIGDRDREQVDERLRAAVGEGRLALGEYDERCRSLWQATTRSELATLTADLPVPSPEVPPSPGPHPRHRVLAVLGENELSGPVARGERVDATSVLGKAVVDLRRTDLPDVVDVRARTLLGETVVLVPRGAHVHLRGTAVLGARHSAVEPGEPGAPVVSVHAGAVLGSVTVTHGDEEPPAGHATHATVARSGEPARDRRRRGLMGRVVPLVALAAVVYGGGSVVTADSAQVFGHGQRNLPSGAAPLDVGVLFGSYEVVVPDGTRVETSGRMAFGGISCDDACAADGPGPVLRVHGAGAFGSIEVLTRSEADQEALRHRTDDDRDDGDDD